MALPPLSIEPVTAADISQLSRTGQLWIAKANHCRLEVISSVEGEDLDGNAIRACINSIADCPLWTELGLNLRPEFDEAIRTTQSSTRICLVISHRDLSSELLVPSDTPSARFQKLSCTFKFRTRTPRRAATIPIERQRQSDRYNLRNGVRSSNTDIASRSGHWRSLVEGDGVIPRTDQTYNGLKSGQSTGPHLEHGTGTRFDNQLPGDTMLEYPGVPTPPSMDCRQPTNPNRTQDTEDWSADISLLVSVALHRLIGVKKIIQGARTTRNLSPSLIDIAPAVWNLRHLRSFTSHMELIPSIASTLAGLAQAQSPAIRRKIQGLLVGGGVDDEQDRVYASIYKSLSLLVHMGLDVEPVLKTRNKRCAALIHSGEEFEASQMIPGPELFEQLTQGTGVDSEDPAISSEPFGDSMLRTSTESSESLFTTVAHGNLGGFDGLIPTNPYDREVAIGMPSQNGMVVNEYGHPVPLEEADDDYEYVYAIVPVQEAVEDGSSGREESQFSTQTYDEPGYSRERPRDWGAWSSNPLPGHGNTGDEIYPGPELYGVNADYAKR